MSKYGKRNVISENLWDYNVCLLGESGIGKTTLMANVCEQLVGEDGYLIFNCGKEDGISCLPNVSYEDVQTFKKWNDVTLDIIKNKNTDYPNLKIITTDTLDQLFEIIEPEALRRWNVDAPIDKKATTLNGAWGGFGKGEDKVIEIILDRLWELKAIGVAFWSCGHTKRREIEDVATGQTYSSLTTNMMQKYFNGVKTKIHLLGIASINREIIAESTGKKNLVTKKDITKNTVKSETRRITFRDDNYSIDSKSRFADIASEIPLDADSFINAMREAISIAKSKEKTKEIKPSIPLQKAEILDDDDIDSNIDESIIEDIEVIDVLDTECLVEDIRKKFKDCQDKNIKSDIKSILSEHGGKLSENIPVDILNNILIKLS